MCYLLYLLSFDIYLDLCISCLPYHPQNLPSKTSDPLKKDKKTCYFHLAPSQEKIALCDDTSFAWRSSSSYQHWVWMEQTFS